MLDKCGRKITYLRISVTNHCNLRCKYCIPGNIKFLPHHEILSFEEITDVVKEAVKLGINKVRLTGGEPLMRRDIVKLVSMLNGIPEITDLSMTTNGILLAQFADPLFTAGIKRINISLDTTDPEYYAEITGGGNIDDVFAGIEAAINVGMNPIKLNCTLKTLQNMENEIHAQAVKKFAAQKNLLIRFIRRMNFANGDFSIVEGGNGGDCKHCNRLRLLCDGNILPCLFSDRKFNIKQLGIREALLHAIEHKPSKGLPCGNKSMCNIGG